MKMGGFSPHTPHHPPQTGRRSHPCRWLRWQSAARRWGAGRGDESGASAADRADTSTALAMASWLPIIALPYIINIPICSMYGIFTYIWVIFRANDGKYSIHGAYGIYIYMMGIYIYIYTLIIGDGKVMKRSHLRREQSEWSELRYSFHEKI